MFFLTISVNAQMTVPKDPSDDPLEVVEYQKEVVLP